MPPTFDQCEIPSPVWLGWKPSQPRIKKTRPEAIEWHDTWTTLSGGTKAIGIESNNAAKSATQHERKMR